eukprot:2930369-Pleurochrysis_carterae.AAC.1
MQTAICCAVLLIRGWPHRPQAAAEQLGNRLAEQESVRVTEFSTRQTEASRLAQATWHAHRFAMQSARGVWGSVRGDDDLERHYMLDESEDRMRRRRRLRLNVDFDRHDDAAAKLRPERALSSLSAVGSRVSSIIRSDSDSSPFPSPFASRPHRRGSSKPADQLRSMLRRKLYQKSVATPRTARRAQRALDHAAAALRASHALPLLLGSVNLESESRSAAPVPIFA